MERHILSNYFITILNVISSVLKLEAGSFSETSLLTYNSKRCQTSEQTNPCNIKLYFISNVQKTFTGRGKRSVLLVKNTKKKRDKVILNKRLTRQWM